MYENDYNNKVQKYIKIEYYLNNNEHEHIV
jgi:hypothetical protein